MKISKRIKEIQIGNKVMEHPFFGMHADIKESVENVYKDYRKERKFIIDTKEGESSKKSKETKKSADKSIG